MDTTPDERAMTKRRAYERALNDVDKRKRFRTFLRLAMIPYLFCIAGVLNAVPTSAGALGYIFAILAPMVVFAQIASIMRPKSFTCWECDARFELGPLAYLFRRDCPHCESAVEPSRDRIPMRWNPDLQARLNRIADPDTDGERERQLAYAAVMNEANAEVPSERAPSRPTTPLAKWAGARGFDVVHPQAIEGEIGGIRVAVEHEEADDGCTYVDADARNVDGAALAALKTAVHERITRARVVVAGPISRIEIRGGDVDPRELDEAIELVEQSLKVRSGGAYR